MQTNRNFSKAGVLRGLHYHHHQVDYWCVVQGMVRVGLADLRPSSPTFQASETVEIGDNNPMGIFHPRWRSPRLSSLTDSVLTYLVDNYYNGADELGVAWNDPVLGVVGRAESAHFGSRSARSAAGGDRVGADANIVSDTVGELFYVPGTGHK